jgi:hypothetical protein
MSKPVIKETLVKTRMDSVIHKEYEDRAMNEAFYGTISQRYGPKGSSLRQVGENIVEIRITKPKTTKDGYFFGLRYLDEIDYAVFVCCNDFYAFKIPAKKLREFGLYIAEDGSLSPTIKYSEGSWYIDHYTNDSGENKTKIDSYKLDIIKVGERRNLDVESEVKHYTMLTRLKKILDPNGSVFT